MLQGFESSDFSFRDANGELTGKCEAKRQTF